MNTTFTKEKHSQDFKVKILSFGLTPLDTEILYLQNKCWTAQAAILQVSSYCASTIALPLSGGAILGEDSCFHAVAILGLPEFAGKNAGGFYGLFDSNGNKSIISFQMDN